MTSLSAAAALLLSSMEEATRDDGSRFLRLSGSAPSWGSNVFMEAHCGELPNDSRYELLRDALAALEDGDYESAEDAQEDLYDISLDLMPCMTSDILAWFSELPRRLGDCDQALEDGRCSELRTFEILSEGWRVGAEESVSVLISSLEKERLSVFNPDTDCRLLLSDSHGVYIPQMYCESISKSEASSLGVDWWAIEACQHGPDGEHYWEAWQHVLDNAVITDESGTDWRLEQSGDLWEIRADAEVPEEWLQ